MIQLRWQRSTICEVCAHLKEILRFWIQSFLMASFEQKQWIVTTKKTSQISNLLGPFLHDCLVNEKNNGETFTLNLRLNDRQRKACPVCQARTRSIVLYLYCILYCIYLPWIICNIKDVRPPSLYTKVANHSFNKTIDLLYMLYIISLWIRLRPTSSK